MISLCNIDRCRVGIYEVINSDIRFWNDYRNRLVEVVKCECVDVMFIIFN